MEDRGFAGIQHDVMTLCIVNVILLIGPFKEVGGHPEGHAAGIGQRHIPGHIVIQVIHRL